MDNIPSGGSKNQPILSQGKGAGMEETEIAAVRAALVGWYLENRRVLPWRETADPYAIWVSEVMLQQTRVETAVPYYRRFMARFPGVAELAAADVQEVLKLWEGLGYYARARNLHQAAGSVAADHGGLLPDDPGAFRKLKGVGDYIAAAVMSIAFGRPCAVVDGNVKRVLARLLRMAVPVNGHDAYPVFEKAAASLLDPADPGRFNQALMELGALVCRPRRPNCGACPVSRFCRAHLAGQAEAYPLRIRKPPVPTRAMVAGVVRKGRRMLITRIPPEGLLGGLWEFPGGAVAEGEEASLSCIRHIRERTGLSVADCRHLGRIRHAYTHFKVVVDLFACRWTSGAVHLDGPADFRWIDAGELAHFPLPGTHHKFMPLLDGEGSGASPGRRRR